MVRGIVASFCYPFAYFASTGFTSSQLYPCTLEATGVLESLGFFVHAFVSDGASPNRRFYKLMCIEMDNIYWTVSPFDEERKIYFISDVPHLLKTTRNCLENSFCNKQSRNMHVSITLNIINYMTRVKAGRNSPSFSVEYSISKGTAFPKL